MDLLYDPSVIRDMEAKKLTPEDLAHMKEWVSKQPHFPKNISDDLLKLFLHSCYYRLEVTKKALETYLTLKTNTPEFFDNRTVEDNGIKHILNVVKFCILPKTSKNGYTVLFAKLINCEVSQFVLDDAIKLLFMVVDTYLKEYKTKSRGLLFLFDHSGVSLGHLTRVNLSSVRKYFHYIQDAMPVRLKGIHIINVNPVMTHIMTMIKPFIHKQHVQHIHLHTPDDIKNMYETIPQDILPKDYNGEESSSDTLSKELLEKLCENTEFFKQDEKLRIDDSKRQDSNYDNFSTHGSFKKLTLD
uniref:CRAL-TRIO domain-containing protein n=1 Tax=Clastoptera arizonana TaxID=38151 RepID=A0A1B6D0A6_9HEMI